MPLVQPRDYQWVVGEREPFVACETSPFRIRALGAADRHAIPFPARVLGSDGYWHAERCRVRLMMVEGHYAACPGANYVMDIRSEGYRERPVDWVRRQIREAVENYLPDANALGPAGNALLGQMNDPSPLATQRFWSIRTPLVNLVSAMQVDEQRVRLQGLVWQAIVRYEWLPAMEP